MRTKYYLDSCIWIDLYENRKGLLGEPLGDYAWKLLSLIKTTNSKLIVTDILFIELSAHYSVPEIRGLMNQFQKFVETIKSTRKQEKEAENIAYERNLPKKDVLHALISRDNKLVLVTRDKHFKKLRDITRSLKPEDLI